MATILNQGTTSVEGDLEGVFDALQDERVNVLATVRQLQLGAQLLGAMEAQRLARKSGPEDPRVVAFAAKSAAMLARVEAIDVELELAKVRVPPVGKTETLVHGRITDEEMKAAGRMEVALVDEGGRPVPGVPAVETDDAGYYAFVLSSEQVEAIGARRKVTVAVKRDDATIAPAAAQAFSVAPGTVAVNEFRLNPSELDQLRLRARFPVPETPVGPGGAADGTSATGTTTVPRPTRPSRAPRGKSGGKK